MEMLSTATNPSFRPAVPRSTPVHPPRKTVFLVQSGFHEARQVRVALEERGYEVIHADSLQASLRIWAKSVTPIDLFIADLGLQSDPGIERLSKLLQAESPRMRILYANGLEQGTRGIGSGDYPRQLMAVVENCLGSCP